MDPGSSVRTSIIILGTQQDGGTKTKTLQRGRSRAVPDQQTAGRIDMPSVGDVDAEAGLGSRFRKLQAKG